MRKIAIPTVLLALTLAACGGADDSAADTSATGEPTAAGTTTAAPPAPERAVAPLLTAESRPAGSATATVEGGKVMIALNVRNMTPGDHGVHVHMIGKCDGPTFETAGGHWNPDDQKHGLEGPEGQHAGDMPNLTVAENGTGTLSYELVGGTFAGLLDADGSAFIVHAGRDDQATDPSGDSGDRVACGVFSAS